MFPRANTQYGSAHKSLVFFSILDILIHAHGMSLGLSIDRRSSHDRNHHVTTFAEGLSRRITRLSSFHPFPADLALALSHRRGRKTGRDPQLLVKLPLCNRRGCRVNVHLSQLAGPRARLVTARRALMCAYVRVRTWTCVRPALRHSLAHHVLLLLLRPDAIRRRYATLATRLPPLSVQANA